MFYPYYDKQLKHKMKITLLAEEELKELDYR